MKAKLVFGRGVDPWFNELRHLQEVNVKRGIVLYIAITLSSTAFALAQRGGGRAGRAGGRNANSGSVQQRVQQAMRFFDVFLLLDQTQRPQLQMIFDAALMEAQGLQAAQSDSSENALFDVRAWNDPQSAQLLAKLGQY